MRWIVILLLAPSTAFADRLVLKEGQVIEGRILSEGEQVVLQIDGGKIAFAKSEIKSIEKDGQGALAQLALRRAALSESDVKGRLAIGRWAKGVGLLAEANVLFAEALEMDPGNVEAHQALGHVKQEGHWLTADEHKRAQGMVRYGGRWITADEAAAADADLRGRAERRRARAEPPSTGPKERTSRVDEIAWGNDQWLGGAPPLADWIYPAYGYPRTYGPSWGVAPRAGINVTITGRAGGPIAAPPRIPAPSASPTGHRGALGPPVH